MSDIKFMNCISCQKEIKRHYFDKNDSHKLDQSCWRDGGVSTFSFGYGSTHDTCLFYICICDECITKGLEKNSVVFKDYYM